MTQTAVTFSVSLLLIFKILKQLNDTMYDEYNV